MTRYKPATLLAHVVVLASYSFFVACSAPTKVAPLTATINENASLSAAAASALPANPLKWRIITSFIDPQNSTMATLYGNDVAVRHARANVKHDYPPGSRIALVTWTRRDDPRYFGARIPDRLKSVEFVSVTEVPGDTEYLYEKFEGIPLAKTQSDESMKASPPAQALLDL